MSQPDPKPNDSIPVWNLVVADMQARDHIGRARYGTPLQAHNGRDALRDAYEEALDQAVYLRQAIVERSDIAAERDRLLVENAAISKQLDHYRDVANKFSDLATKLQADHERTIAISREFVDNLQAARQPKVNPVIPDGIP